MSKPEVVSFTPSGFSENSKYVLSTLTQAVNTLTEKFENKSQESTELKAIVSILMDKNDALESKIEESKELKSITLMLANKIENKELESNELKSLVSMLMEKVEKQENENKELRDMVILLTSAEEAIPSVEDLKDSVNTLVYKMDRLSIATINLSSTLDTEDSLTNKNYNATLISDLQ